MGKRENGYDGQAIVGQGGYLKCRQVNEERVVMSGQAVLYMTGEINCPAE